MIWFFIHVEMFLCEQSHSLRFDQPYLISEVSISPVIISEQESNIRILYYIENSNDYVKNNMEQTMEDW